MAFNYITKNIISVNFSRKITNFPHFLPFLFQGEQIRSASKSPVNLISRLEGMFASPGEDEINAVHELVRNHDRQYKSINFGEDLIKEMIMSSLFGIPLSAKAAMTAYRLMMQRVTRVAQNCTDFIDLPCRVQGALLKNNSDLVVSLQAAVFFKIKKHGLEQILSSLGIDDIETAKSMIAATLQSHSTTEEDYKKIDYKKFNTLQEKADNTASEARYDILLSRVGATVGFNQNLIKVLSYVLLFCSDFRDERVEDTGRRGIEKAQEGLIAILQRYIFATYPQNMATTVFAGTMECLGNLRELCFIKQQRRLAQVSNSTPTPPPLVQ